MSWSSPGATPALRASSTARAIRSSMCFKRYSRRSSMLPQATKLPLPGAV